MEVRSEARWMRPEGGREQALFEGMRCRMERQDAAMVHRMWMMVERVENGGGIREGAL